MLTVYPRFMHDASHELGWSQEEKLRGVCSLHRRDAYPNISTNSWDGDLVAQGSVGTKTVWAPARDSSLFYLSDSGAASRGNPCLKLWPSLLFSSLLQAVNNRGTYKAVALPFTLNMLQRKQYHSFWNHYANTLEKDCVKSSVLYIS